MDKSRQTEAAAYITVGDGAKNVHLPHQYDFHDWPLFKEDVLRYHRISYPGQKELSDRIATFRSFMSPQVIDYLSNRCPAIFDSAEFQSLTDWQLRATELLRKKDATIPPEGAVDGATERLAEKYDTGTISDCSLWVQLNNLVYKNAIPPRRQIQVFWDCHSIEEQRQLVDLCPYFDPRGETWGDAASPAHRVFAMMLLHDALMSDVNRLESKYHRLATIYGVLTCIATIATAVMFSLLAIPADTSRDDAGMVTVFIVVGILCAVVDAVLAFLLLVFTVAWRKALKRKKAYHFGNIP